MAARVSLWERVAHWFRSPEGRSTKRAAGPAATVLPSASDSAGALEVLGSARGSPWWRRRQDRLAQTREVSRRMLELVGAMQEHFRRQDQRAAELAGSLGQVGGVLEQLADSQRAHGECLRAIAEHAETTGRHAAQLSDKLGRLPESLATQAEAIRVVARQLEVSQEADTQLMHSLQQFGRAVDTLGASGTAQVEMLQRLNAVQREQHAALSALVHEQGRRFALVMFVAALLATIALAALVVAVLVYINR